MLVAAAYGGLCIVDGVPATFNLMLGLTGIIFAAMAWKVRA